MPTTSSLPGPRGIRTNGMPSLLMVSSRRRHGCHCAENDLLLGDQNWRLAHLFGDGLNRRDSIRHPVGCRYHCLH